MSEAISSPPQNLDPEDQSFRLESSVLKIGYLLRALFPTGTSLKIESGDQAYNRTYTISPLAIEAARDLRGRVKGLQDQLRNPPENGAVEISTALKPYADRFQLDTHLEKDAAETLHEARLTAQKAIALCDYLEKELSSAQERRLAQSHIDHSEVRKAEEELERAQALHSRISIISSQMDEADRKGLAPSGEAERLRAQKKEAFAETVQRRNDCEEKKQRLREHDQTSQREIKRTNEELKSAMEKRKSAEAQCKRASSLLEEATKQKDARAAAARRLCLDPPKLPPDLFAAAGMLLDLSGACHHVVPVIPNGEWRRGLSLSKQEKQRAASAGKEWRTTWTEKDTFELPEAIRRAWTDLLGHWEAPVFKVLAPDAPAPQWWRDALFLIVAADEAASGFGFPDGSQRSEPELKLELVFDTVLTVQPPGAADSASDLVPTTKVYSISSVPRDMVCVLPKSRTAQLGCTVRSLSHNLALLPARGRARAYWNMLAPHFRIKTSAAPLNLLLIPYPYSISPSAFRASSPDAQEARDWRWFEMEPTWIDESNIGMNAGLRFNEERPDVLIGLVTDLLRVAKKKANSVNGIVFPEAAVSWGCFEHLINHIKNVATHEELYADLEFIVAGLRTNKEGKPGNYAGTCLFSPVVEEDGKKTRFMINANQQKHHRWRVDRRQVVDYGLGSALPAGMRAWEKIELLSRSLHVFVFRDCSTLAPLICEDLARIEPVHDLVRSIGPNLIIALLLDGPQVASRWPGRYAMGLADDPGSSVLTLTSYGLLERANKRASGGFKSNSIGLWRDETGETKELVIEPGSSAILLSLAGEAVTERTIDGRRSTSDSMRWIFADQTSLTVERHDYAWARAGVPPP